MNELLSGVFGPHWGRKEKKKNLRGKLHERFTHLSCLFKECFTLVKIA